MTRQNMTEDNVERKKPKEWMQILAIFSAALSSFNSAALFCWPSPSIPNILTSNEYPDIDLESTSYLTITPPIAAAISSVIYAQCIDRFGRKLSLLSSAIFHSVSWILIARARSISLFQISRIIGGIGDGAMFAVVPVYIAEVTTPKIRGSWGNAMSFFLYFGQFAINTVGYYCSVKVTAYIFLTFPIIFFVSFIFMPESPYYYIMKGNFKEAEKSLKKLRRIEDVSDELQQLKSDLQIQLSEKGTYRDLFFVDSNRRALGVAVLTRIIQLSSGITIFSVYNQYIFQAAGEEINRGHSSIIYTAILATSSLLSSTFTDKLGRNLSMTISCCGCAVLLLSEAAYFFAKQNNLVDLSPINWLPVLLMAMYVLSFSVGLGLVPILLQGELFSTSVRGKASTLIAPLASAYVAAVTKVFQSLNSNFGLWAPFVLFSFCTTLGIFLSRYLIPETKGKTLEEIQQMLRREKKEYVYSSLTDVKGQILHKQP